ncbi:TPA: CRISPR-associated protein Cas4 [Candidatus Poribacteria bacterium]|nr:CRISPR-associated protein Cas4 [Candidatus Poribacteria bacterium]
MDTLDINITGTLIWYYYICKRQVWLMAHAINPDEDNPYIDLGRLVHETSYQRENKKEIMFDNVKMDIITDGDQQIVVAEIKKSSRYEKSATMQLAFYLKKLKDVGISASGELRFPTEKRREKVELTDEISNELDSVREEIKSIILMEKAPKPEKCRYCPPCGYNEFCWV